MSVFKTFGTSGTFDTLNSIPHSSVLLQKHNDKKIILSNTISPNQLKTCSDNYFNDILHECVDNIKYLHYLRQNIVWIPNSLSRKYLVENVYIHGEVIHNESKNSFKNIQKILFEKGYILTEIFNKPYIIFKIEIDNEQLKNKHNLELEDVKKKYNEELEIISKKHELEFEEYIVKKSRQS